MKFKSLFLAFVFSICLASSIYARQVGPVQFDELITVKDVPLRLHGAGLKKFVNFKVVSVGLYLPPSVNADQVFNNVPKSLEVVYLLSIPKSELDRATEKGMAQNVDQKQYQQLKSRIDQINSYYQDVSFGDRIGVTYIPEVGSLVTFNGQLRGIVPGEDFAKAFFAIWVGAKPVDKVMKAKLLGT